MPFTQSLRAFIQEHDKLNSAVMPVYMRTVHPVMTKRSARKQGVGIRSMDRTIEFKSGDRAIHLAKRHAIYANDVIDNFDFYYGAVEPFQIDGISIVDYSSPRYHDVVGYGSHPVYFPSLAEPIVTTLQYLEFAQLKAGSIALDLGAYSGLTSIMMRERCGDTGRVVAIDADSGNAVAIRKNLALYEQFAGRSVEFLEAAVWIHDDGINFSAEGNMGSASTEFVGNRLGSARRVPSTTLSNIGARYDLPRVDFIKCDIEGAEAVIFEDSNFFQKYRPRILAEVHLVKGQMTSVELTRTLERYGYRCREVSQPGSSLPLLECTP